MLKFLILKIILLNVKSNPLVINFLLEDARMATIL